jgi:polyisoprenoid-binding protein YceI
MATASATETYPIPLSSGDWRIVASGSELGFSTRALGFIPVRGRYSDFDGELYIDAAGTASGALRVDAETISTGIKKRDSHLRSKDFFHVEVHPHITFELTGLAPAADGTVRLTGTLRVRDQAQAVDTAVTVAQVGAAGLRIDAQFEVDHRAAGFEFKRLPKTVRIQAALTLERLS